jgi:hypothetical protein
MILQTVEIYVWVHMASQSRRTILTNSFLFALVKIQLQNYSFKIITHSVSIS